MRMSAGWVRGAWRGLCAMLLALAAGLAADPGAAQPSGRSCTVLLVPPDGAGGNALQPFAARLPADCRVRPLVMPWSPGRNWDKPFAGAVDDIAAEARALRRDGVRRVLVAGQGLGANAALAFAAQHGDADAVIALMPLESAPAARDPQGLGDPARQAPRLRQHTALLWVVAAGSAMAQRGEAFAYARATPHAHSRYWVLPRDGLLDAAGRAVADWLKETE